MNRPRSVVACFVFCVSLSFTISLVLLYAEEFFVQDNDLTGEVPDQMCVLRSLGLEDFRVDCNESMICEAPQCCTFCF
jgi:hypothetical protein